MTPRYHCPVSLITANTPKRTSMSNAALSIRISCVLGCTNRQTEAHNTTTSDMRKTNDNISLNILLNYPILTSKSSKKYPKLLSDQVGNGRASCPVSRPLRLDTRAVAQDAFISRTVRRLAALQVCWAEFYKSQGHASGRNSSTVCLPVESSAPAEKPWPSRGSAGDTAKTIKSSGLSDWHSAVFIP